LTIPEKIAIRDYQSDAYSNWVDNNFSGLLAMATGTGKTITALNIVFREYENMRKRNPDYASHILILVPTQPLLEQWTSEIYPWGLNSVYEVSGKTDWKSQLQTLASDFEFGIDSEFVIIATYRSFTNEYFQNILKRLPNDTILIADEAHNIGQLKVRQLLSKFPFDRRIGLSATPRRIYDPVGTAEMENFFNDSEPYTFSLFMDEAIKLGNLCQYEYYPILVELEQDELDQYVDITLKIVRFSSKQGTDDEKQILEKLLLKRKRIVDKAKGKLKALSIIIDELIDKYQKIEYCFTYVPPGEWEDEETAVDKESIRIIRQMQKMFDQRIPNIRTHVYLGETKNRKQVLQGFENGDIDVLLAINCLDEGVNVPRTGIGIFTSSTGNPRQFIQRRGRLLRNHIDKDRAVIYDMVVIPKINLKSKEKDFSVIQRNLVKNELMRVGYFAKLSQNFYDTKNALNEVCEFYQLDLDTIISELER